MKKWDVSNSLDITIGRNIWIGANCTILGGSIIPNNSLIGAGSVYNLKSDLENSLFVGIPAKFKKSLHKTPKGIKK